MANIYNDAARIDFKAKVKAYFNGANDVVDYIKSLELNYDNDNDKKTFAAIQSDFMSLGIAIYLLRHDKSVTEDNIDARVKTVRETAKASRTAIDQAAFNATAVKWHSVKRDLGLVKQRENAPSASGSKGTDKGADAPAPVATIKASEVKSFDDLLKASEAIAGFLAELVKAGMTVKPSHGLALGLDRARQSLRGEIAKALAEANAKIENAKVMADKAKAKANDAKAKAKATKAEAKGKPSRTDAAIKEGLAAIAKVAAI